MEELLDILFGMETFVGYIAAQIFGLLGLISMATASYIYKWYYNSQTPMNLGKWLKNNWLIIIAFMGLLMIIMFVGLRFQQDIIESVKINSNYNLEFVKDKWFWFYLGGLFFKTIIWGINIIYKKLSRNEIS